MCVAPKHQKFGYCTKLVGKAIAEAKKYNIDAVLSWDILVIIQNLVLNQHLNIA
jgi:hypothetical protein